MGSPDHSGDILRLCRLKLLGPNIFRAHARIRRDDERRGKASTREACKTKRDRLAPRGVLEDSGVGQVGAACQQTQPSGEDGAQSERQSGLNQMDWVRLPWSDLGLGMSIGR